MKGIMNCCFRFENKQICYYKQLINKLNEVLELRSQNDIELYVKEVEKRGTRIGIETSGYNLAGSNHFNSEIFAELRRVEHKDLEEMVYRMELTYDEIVDILDVKHIAGSPICYTLPPGLYKISDFTLMVKSLFPDEVKVNFTIDDIRLKSNLRTNKTLRFTIKSFFKPY